MLVSYYQVIMMIDIFQYSNMYTLRKSIQWLADESHVKEECGPYVTKKGNLLFWIRTSARLTIWLGKNIPDWPKLLHLYSRLRPGKSIFDWIKEFDVEIMGIDVRRFTSFGVIKVSVLYLSIAGLINVNLGLPSSSAPLSSFHTTRFIRTTQ